MTDREERDMGGYTEAQRREMKELQERSDAAAAKMCAALNDMQTVLEAAWEWYEGTRNETQAVTG